MGMDIKYTAAAYYLIQYSIDAHSAAVCLPILRNLEESNQKRKKKEWKDG